GMREDNDFAMELATCCHARESQVCIPKSDRDLANIEANYKAVFGARLHSMICAYSFGVPVAGFIWDEKIVHFAEMAKLESCFLREQDINGKAMFDVLLHSLHQEEDSDNRICWKETTKKTIF